MPNIYLVGFMGAGKTSVGRELARALECAFVDLDSRLEDSFGMPIRDVFQARGEAVFREAEREELLWCVGLDGAVVSTGGGAFCDPVNRDIIHSNEGVSVFLDVPWEELARRLEGDPDTRPLFTGLDAARDLYRDRRPHYETATWTVAVTGSESPTDVAERIASFVARTPCGT